MLTLISFMSWFLILCSSSNVECTLCKEQNDCSVYILKRTVQYRLLRKLKTLGHFRATNTWCEKLKDAWMSFKQMWIKWRGRYEKRRIKKKKWVRLKTRKFSTTQSWLRLFVLNGAVCPSVSKLSSLSILCLTKKNTVIFAFLNVIIFEWTDASWVLKNKWFCLWKMAPLVCYAAPPAESLSSETECIRGKLQHNCTAVMLWSFELTKINKKKITCSTCKSFRGREGGCRLLVLCALYYYIYIIIYESIYESTLTHSKNMIFF